MKNMKKVAKKLAWIFGPIILIIVVIVVYGVVNRSNTSQYSTVTAELNDLKQIVEATGSVASAEDLNLAFKTTGRIQNIDTKIGAEVKRGETLANVLDLTLNSKVDRARAAVVAAQANLDKLLSGAKAEDIQVSQEKITKAEADLSKAKIDLVNEADNRTQYREIYLDTALQSIDDALFAVSYSLDAVNDGILDNAADIDLITTEQDSLVSAEAKYDQALEDYSLAKSYDDTAISSPTKANLLQALYKTRDTLEETLASVNLAFDVVAGGIAKGAYTSTVLDNWKTAYNTRATSIGTKKTSIQASINDLTVDWLSLDNAYDDAKAAVQTAENALALAEAQHDALIAEPKDYEIKQAQAKLLQAQADLSAAQSDWADTVITAPVDGLITNVDMEVGELAGPNNIVIEMIGDNTLQIDVDIPEADISKVKVDQTADITLDAFGTDRKFHGKVTFIEPSERLVQDVVYYRVTVIFDQNYDDVKPGMTADVAINTAERQGVVAVPLRAVIIDKDGNKTVKVLENDQPVIRTVSTGIRDDEGLIEIISGLEAGETVITGELQK